MYLAVLEFLMVVLVTSFSLIHLNKLAEETVVCIGDQRHDEVRKEPIAQIACIAKIWGPSYQPKGAKREPEGQAEIPRRPSRSRHLCKASQVERVFGGGSIYCPPGHCCAVHSYTADCSCLPFIMARGQSCIPSAERDRGANHHQQRPSSLSC